MINRFFLLLICWHLLSGLSAQGKKETLITDVLVIGGGTGGTAAAIQSARMGVKTILVEQTTMLGGMLTAAGVSCTDGNNDLPSGIWEEFRQALQKHYQKRFLNTGWVSWTNFEPRVGDSIFKSWASKEKDLQVHYQQLCIQVLKKGNKVTGALFTDMQQNITTIHAKIIIDGTELGDVMAKAGAAYDVGMDDPTISGEKEAKQKNNIIQDLTWVAILKDYGKDADKTISKPEGYDPEKYYCCCTDAPCKNKPWNGDKIKMLNYGKLPRSPGAKADKYMLNWPAHGNDYYLNVVENNWSEREVAYVKAKNYTRGFIYFMQTELGFKNLGLADDELNNGMALIPYNREGRRLKGMVRLTIDHIKNPFNPANQGFYRTGISVGDYPVDHHHAQYPGNVPELEFPDIPSYNIPLGTLIPEKVDGLIVCDKGISVTNIVNGTTRLQPVVLLTGQAAGVLAALTVKTKKQPRQIPVRDVQTDLMKAKCYLMPYVDVKPNDADWASIQRIGVTGILRGVGKAEGWANKTYFYPDSIANMTEFYSGLFSYTRLMLPTRWMRVGPQNIGDFFTRLKKLKPYVFTKEFQQVNTIEGFQLIWSKYGLNNFDKDRLITRREVAVIFDKCMVMFVHKNFPMDHNGRVNFKFSEL